MEDPMIVIRARGCRDVWPEEESPGAQGHARRDPSLEQAQRGESVEGAVGDRAVLAKEFLHLLPEEAQRAVMGGRVGRLDREEGREALARAGAEPFPQDSQSPKLF